MINIILNNNPYKIKSLSELSFTEFNEIMVRGKVADLMEYISVMTGLPIGDLKNAKVRGSSSAQYNMIFDVDVSKTIKDSKNVVKYKGEYHLVDEIKMKTFGQSYYYDLYRQKHSDGKINRYELCLYALAIALSDTLDDKIEKIYKELSRKNWMKVLPQGFFLARKSTSNTAQSIMLLLHFTADLKRMESRISNSKKLLIDAEKT